MKKWFVMILFATVLAFTAGIKTAPVTHAEYTQEEKEQAKAWLSAHGYAPTREGAAQAYQDYLNGKFDEELKDNPALQQMAPATTETATTEKTTEKKEECMMLFALNAVLKPKFRSNLFQAKKSIAKIALLKNKQLKIKQHYYIKDRPAIY